MSCITKEIITAYTDYLRSEEKSERTISKYENAVRSLEAALPENSQLDKPALLRWKKSISARYKANTINAMIAAVNGFCAFLGLHNCRLRPVKVQQSMFRQEDRELTKKDYYALLNAAAKEGNDRLQMIMETLAGTGIRISELRFITAEAVENGQTIVDCKGKQRIVFLTEDLCRLLKRYMRRHNITEGPVFVTRNGRPVDRSNVWHEMKRLCKVAGINKQKVFPHNFRHLFAVIFYKIHQDIVKLADVLGHSSIDTTRTYLAEKDTVHRMLMKALGRQVLRIKKSPQKPVSVVSVI